MIHGYFRQSGSRWGERKLRWPPSNIELHQPAGASFTIEGHQVSWQHWRLHFRVDPRVGPVVSAARYIDKSVNRSVLYEGSVSEMFVPYMDPDTGWYLRTYRDAGEYGLGNSPRRCSLVWIVCHSLATSMRFLPVPYTQERVAC